MTVKLSLALTFCVLVSFSGTVLSCALSEDPVSSVSLTTGSLFPLST